MITFEDVSLRYDGAAVDTLSEVSFTVEEGSLALVLGRTGSGKSTLLGCVNNLVPRFTGGRRTGRVLLDSEDISAELPRDLADRIGYVGQDPLSGFVTDTVEEELAYTMEQLGMAPRVMRSRVEETLDLLGIADLRSRALRTLSGGQQQRVAIGSVLTAAPSVLVLDEPTSALDPTAAEEVIGVLLRLVHDLSTTVLIAEHRMERVVEYADTLLLVDGSRVVSGEPAAVMAAAPIAPPVVELGRALDWQPLPLNVRDGRRAATGLRRAWARQPPELDRDTPETRTASLLRAGGVVVHYGETVAVAGVDLDLAAGEVVALMGRNGSGKSSLLWALQGAGRRHAGRVRVDGVPLRPRSNPEIALVPQTAADLLYLETVEQECAAADRAGDLTEGTCAALLARLVPGIDASQHPRDLSEGQRLALVLALQLCHSPRVVLLDEPTRGLDYTAKGELCRIVADLAAAGRSVVVATHDVEFAALACHRVVQMAQGEVIQDGPVRTVITGSALLATQAAKVTAPHRLLTVTEVLAAVPTAGEVTQ